MSERTSKEAVLAKVKAALGFVPKMFAGIVEQNPAVADMYLAGSTALAGGVLAPKEKQVVMLAASAFNECHYCTAVHRTGAKSMGVSQDDLDAIDDGREPSDERLRNLTRATWKVLSERGWLDDAAIGKLGISRPELYEVIALIGLKTVSNYINHIQATEVDAPLQAQARRVARKLA